MREFRLGCILLLYLETRISFGASWEIADPGAANPQNVFFTDFQHGVLTATTSGGFVFGGEGVEAIRWTEDGGETWQGAQADMNLESYGLSGLWFSNGKTGWVAGTGRDASQRVLLKSEDGGKNWKRQPLPEFVTNISQVWFDQDAKRGWLNSSAGPALWRTTAGGATWETVTPPHPDAKRNLQFHHPGFYAISFEHIVLAGNGGLVFISRDAGGTWKAVENSLEGDDAGLQAVHFAPDGKNGWAIGGEGRRITGGGWAQLEKTVVLHTADGGLTWERQSLPDMKTPLTDVWAISAAEAWISSFGGYALPRFVSARMFHTTNGGKLWQDETPSTFSIRKLFFLDARHGWAVGGQGGSPHEPARAVLIYR